MVLYDEPLYAKTAYQFFLKGSVNSNFPAFGGKEFFLYPLLLSFWNHFFTVSLFNFRLFSAFMGGLTVFFIMDIARKLRLSLTRQLLLGFFVFIANTSFVGFRIIRPEALSSFIYVLVVWQLISVLQKESFSRLLILGFFSALLGITHLVASIFSFFILFFLVFYLKNKKNILGIFLGIAPIFIIFCIHFFIFLNFNLSSLIFFLTHSSKFSFHSNLSSVLEYNWNVFFSKYCLEWKRVIIVFIEFFIVFISIFYHKKHPLLLILSLSSLAYLIIGNAILLFLRPYYMLWFLNTLVLISVLFSLDIHLAFLKFLLVSLIFIHTAGDVLFLYMNRHNTSFSDIKLYFSNVFFKSDFIFSPSEFWFLSPQSNWCTDADQVATLLKNHYSVKLIVSNFNLSKLSTSTRLKSDDSDLFFQERYDYFFQLVTSHQSRLLLRSINSYGTIDVYELRD